MNYFHVHKCHCSLHQSTRETRILLIPGAAEIFANPIFLSSTLSGLQNQLHLLALISDQRRFRVTINKTEMIIFRRGAHYQEGSWYFSLTPLGMVNISRSCINHRAI